MKLRIHSICKVRPGTRMSSDRGCMRPHSAMWQNEFSPGNAGPLCRRRTGSNARCAEGYGPWRQQPLVWPCQSHVHKFSNNQDDEDPCMKTDRILPGSLFEVARNNFFAHGIHIWGMYARWCCKNPSPFLFTPLHPFSYTRFVSPPPCAQ